ncbi:NAD(P)/FAD-dependent oxidoreductase [Maribacter polysaccharolyticus]|uniref:NAD(P)/FAD-dependent oxidoreductase n=1 Tax=Maribacter polysaccharolyticus TaxID=3020831 RepID=UPI00237F07AF|nr:NAD(P)/FAD-dependent oxidoreductase [Maribacter polysaccharolyticus]MDE3742929.1 NAD(P)/FAD-dependent oxidoreductase [Maribacter polysaccharolyticus]
MFDVIIIGGGASGFYAAIHIAEADPGLKVAILEKGKNVLKKVSVSGGGRCNVTHGEFDPMVLTKNYPRGAKELLGPFYTHGPQETMHFFESRGVRLKTEEDGRVFPVSNSSQTIIDCFLNETQRLGIQIYRQSAVTSIEASATENNTDTVWKITTVKKQYLSKKLLVTAGSNPKIWKLLEGLGHSIVQPVPSLFTFNIKDERISGIPGVSTPAKVDVLPRQAFNPKITVDLKSRKNIKTLFSAEGPVLITHWGLSGPAILRLSAWGALKLHDSTYRFPIRVNWLPDYHQASVLSLLLEVKEVEGKKTVLRTKVVDIPKRLWTNLVKASGITNDGKWADATREQLQQLADQLTNSRFMVEGKSTFKDEFVTAGGVDLKEINFKTYESKLCKGLYFAGEIINVDAITGGFNFQNAWTGGYIAAMAITDELKK